MPNVEVPGVGVVAFPDEMSPDNITYAIRTDILPRAGLTERGQQPGLGHITSSAVSVTPSPGAPVTADWVARRARMRELRGRQEELDAAGVAADKSLAFLTNLQNATLMGEAAAQMAEPHRQALEVANMATQDLLGVPPTPYQSPTLPRVPVPREAGTAEQVAAGVVNAAEAVPDFLMTPEGMATLGLGAIAGPVRNAMLAVLGGGMATQVPGALEEAATTLAGDAPLHEKTQAVAGAALAVLGATPVVPPVVRGVERISRPGRLAEPVATSAAVQAADNTKAVLGAAGEETNAETIRGDQGQVRAAGGQPEGVQNQGGQDLQQPASGAALEAGPAPSGGAQGEVTDLSRPPASSLEGAPEDVKSTASSLIAKAAQGLSETGDALAGLGLKAKDFLTGEVLPRTTARDQATGEAGARYGASPVYAKRAADAFTHDVLQGVDPVKLGTALTEDNLRDIRATFEDRAEEAMREAEKEAKAGHPNVAAERAKEASDLQEQANDVTTTIGKEGSPFADEQAYREFLDRADTQAAIERHRQRYEAEINPLYRQARDLAPETELAGRGLETGARINLFVPPEEGGVPQIRTTPDLKATFKKRTRFANRASGAGDYGLDYRDIMANTYAGLLEIASKNEFDRALVKSGNAVIDKPGLRPDLQGEKTEAFPLRARTVLTPEGAVVPQDKMIYVRESLAGEYLAASNARKPGALSQALARVLNKLNVGAIAGLVDPVIHVGNLTTALYTRPATTAGLAADAALGLVPPAHVAVAVGRALQRGFEANWGQIRELAKLGEFKEALATLKEGTQAKREQLAELANIGALRDESHAGKVSALLGWYDRSVRLVLDDAYQRLAKQGLVEDSETARREFVNQVGNYNKRLQDDLTASFKGAGVSPFIVAGRTFNKLAMATAVMSPGVEAAGGWQALALRANVVSKWLGVGAGIALWNYINTGNVLGRPGTPLGDVDTGKNDAAGRMVTRKVSDWFGMGRALRVTGVRGAVDASRLGLTGADQVDAALRDAINAQIAPLAGPVVQATSIALTGHPAAVEVRRKGLPAAPGESHFAANALTAAMEVNSVVAGIHELMQPGKTWKDFVARQFPRYGPQQGMPESLVARFAQVVTKTQTKKFTDAVVSEARRMPVEARPGWLQQQLLRVPESERTKVYQEFRTRVLAHP